MTTEARGIQRRLRVLKRVEKSGNTPLGENCDLDSDHGRLNHASNRNRDHKATE